jgi:hypothetical protein
MLKKADAVSAFGAIERRNAVLWVAFLIFLALELGVKVRMVAKKSRM